MDQHVIKIYSENDNFQILRALKENRQKRQKEKKFLFEGVRLINNALQFGWEIEAFVYSPERVLSTWASNILQNSKAKVHYEMPLSLLEKLSNKEDASELLVVGSIRTDNLNKIAIQKNLLVVVFDRPSSHGNLGTLIRSCDAFGAQGLIITGHAVDLYDPETIASTTGSFFSFPLVRIPSHVELFTWIDSVKEQLSDLQVVATDERGTADIYNHDFTKPTILLVGNETKGLSAAYKERADKMVKIPMQGSASSLNVASASSIVLYEVLRQRGIK